MKMSIFKTVYNSIAPLIAEDIFQIPNNQKESTYFPDYLTELLSKYRSFYSSNLITKIDDVVPFENGYKNVLYNKIDNLTNALIQTVQLYYDGKVHEASKIFFKILDELLFDSLGLTDKIKINTSFYRARTDKGKHFSRKDLFHVDFKSRNFVSTNRYSIPGFPALYLGDTTYVCWEEFDRHRLRELWFSKVVNKEELNILQIHRIEDLLSEIDIDNNELSLTYLLRYLVTFPLILACTIKVQNQKGNFKPEYIIPQLLSEYISRQEQIDGIKFPSTNVDYSRLEGIKAYNYVFPVKKVLKEGYCPKLKTKFHLTEPTSLELEEILHNPPFHPMKFGGETPTDSNQIELIKGQKTFYCNTSFGKIENCFIRKSFDSI